MSMVLIEIGVLLVLILANGLFAMSELAVVTARKARLKHRAREGERGAAIALELANDPNRFLPTVQVGITLVGTLAGAFGGLTLAEYLAARLEAIPALAPYSEAIALGVVVLGITYVTLVLGELVPKRLALSRPERIAGLVAIPLKALSWVAVPAVRFLGGSTELILRIFGVRPTTEPTITEEEVEALLTQGAEAGVFEPSERDLVQRAFRLSDRRAGELMTPRPEVAWIDVADPPFEIRRKIAASPHSRFPVCEGDIDNVLGVVQVKDLLVQGFRGEPFNIRGNLIMPLFLYEGTPGYKVLELFKASRQHFGIVLDEYGSVEGVITLNDILEALVGGLPGEGERDEPAAVRRADGSWLLDGRLLLDEVRERLGLPPFPEGDYRTLAGFVIDRLGRIPSEADRFEWAGARFEVADMDGHRIDKVLVVPPRTGPDEARHDPDPQR